MSRYPDARRRRHVAPGRSALLIALTASLLLGGLPLRAVAAPDPPGSLSPDPAPDRDYQVTFQVGSGAETGLPQGGSITLPIRVSVSGAVGLASASVLVQYDPGDLRATGCAPSANAPGGYCNAAYDPANGLARFNLLANGGILGDNVALFELTFETAGTSTVNRLSQVTPLIETLADTQGEPMTSSSRGTPVRVLAASGSGPAVYVGAVGGPNPISITRAATVTVPIVVTDVADLGSASFSLPYTASVARAVECRALQPAGSDISAVCATREDRVEAGLLSGSGFSGSATLFEVVFTTSNTARPGLSSPLNLTVEAFADLQGAPVPVRVVNNSLSVSGADVAPAPRLRLEPQTQTLTGDARITLHLFLDDGDRVAAGSWSLRYARNLLLAESCRFSDTAADAGVSGACNATGEPGQVRMSMLNPTPGPPIGELAAITFRRNPATLLNAPTTVSIDVASLADVTGEPLASRAQNATVQLSGGLGGAADVTLAWGDQTTYELAIGRSLELPLHLTVDAARPLGSLTASLFYDPTVLRATRCVRASADKTNYSGYCNAHYDRTNGAVRFNLLSQEGVSGALAPFLLTFEPVSGAPVGKHSLLQFRMEATTGPQGEPRTWSLVQPGITVLAPAPAAQVKIGDPPDDGQYALELGKPLTVPVSIVEVTDLGAATIRIKYDARVVRAAGCVARNDLIAYMPAGGGGYCSIAPTAAATGTITAAFIIPDGFTGASRFFELTFIEAPNADVGLQSPLIAQVDNFVSTAGVPIPTTTGNGSIQIPCKLPAPALSIALLPNDDVKLSWPHITKDACGLPVTVTEYQLWRDRAPHNSTAAVPYAIVPTPAGANESTVIDTTDTGTRWVQGGFFYRVVAVARPRPPSDFSNLKGKFTYGLFPGTP